MKKQKDSFFAQTQENASVSSTEAIVRCNWDKIICDNCKKSFAYHCKKHAIPCCPGKCPQLLQYALDDLSQTWNNFALEFCYALRINKVLDWLANAINKISCSA